MGRLFALVLALALLPGIVATAADKAPAGLVLTYTSTASTQSDSVLASGVSLYVKHGQSPTPFLPAGPFTAAWEGAILADLRGTFVFQAALGGTLALEINGVKLLSVTGAPGGTNSALSAPIQLNKGANAFKATFVSPENRDAFVRLNWAEKGSALSNVEGPFTTPIPAAAFSHSPSPSLAAATTLHLGRELFLQFRCANCHTAPRTEMPELKMDAPSFEGIGARRHYDWMARWLVDPVALRPSARMPKLFHGDEAKAQAEAIAAFLASLRGGEAKPPAAEYRTHQNEPKPDETPPAAGEPKPLYERLHCLGCHNPPDAAMPDPQKLSQKRVAEKFPAGKLAEYLQAPEANDPWTRMPNFHLSAAEAKELEAWLFAAAPKANPAPAPTAPDLIEKGRQLVQTAGCLNCHPLKLENQAKAPALAELAPEHWNRGCLALSAGSGQAPTNDPSTKAPQFHFTLEQRAALQAFGRTDRSALTRHVPSEFAQRQLRDLNCAACHGPLEGIPPLDLLGAKLKPEWAGRFIAGAIPHKIRYDAHPRGEPWLEARMPGFPTRGVALATGLAAANGFPPHSSSEPPNQPALAEIGRKLVGKEGGFSCVSCHGVGKQLAMEVFESEGVNLAFAADRLQPDFYRRWLRAPSSVDPQTKMPAYFDEGKSPLEEILGGNAEKQISAIWEYLRLRERMVPPDAAAP